MTHTTKIFLMIKGKPHETHLQVLPYKGCTVIFDRVEYKVKDVVVYADLNRVHIIV